MAEGFMVCEDSDLMLAVDVHTGQITGRLRVGHKPKGIALSPSGKTLYVSNEWDDTITEIDAHSLQPRRTLEAGWGPVGVLPALYHFLLRTPDWRGPQLESTP
jgi:YVTN family beta-propeller protein